LAQTPPAALAAKAATTTIPIVFVVGFDPVAGGLVTNQARPEGNITGLSLQQTDVAGKRLGLLLELSPKSPVVAMIVNPKSPNSAPDVLEAQKAATAVGVHLMIINASTPDELDVAFAALAKESPNALLIGADPFFVNRVTELVALATRLRIPTAYPNRAYADAGGLMSYGTNVANVYRQAAAYAGRILKGEKPADLPVTRPTTFELVVNLHAAKMIEARMPNSILLLADEVIE
jgi:putative ABC transport system substrate-binding protein